MSLEELKKLERNLGLREEELHSREKQLQERERNLEKQFHVVVKHLGAFFNLFLMLLRLAWLKI